MGEVVASLPPPSNVVFDVDGCLTLRGRAIPGARQTLIRLNDLGIQWLIATNNSTRSAAFVATHLGEALELTVAPERVVTSAMAAAVMLGPTDSPALVVGETGLRAELEAAGIALTDDPDAAASVVVGLDRSFDYKRLSLAIRAVSRGARLVASNDDVTFPDPAGDLPGAGALLAAVTAATGLPAEVAGKPHAAMLGLVQSRLRPGATWVVGDRPETDVALARAGGWLAVLVLTGVWRNPSTVPPPWQPDVILPSVAELPGLL